MARVSGPENVTTLLHAWQRGDRAAFDAIVPLIYDELHRLAEIHLRGEWNAHTLSPTVLVSEVYLRLVGGAPLELHDRAHFLATASRKMRQILVDHARKRCADKRGGGQRPDELDPGLVAKDRSAEFVALDEALDQLAEVDERKARIIELHYFGGMTQPEIAAACDLHVNTVARDLVFAQAWLRSRLAEPD